MSNIYLKTQVFLKNQVAFFEYWSEGELWSHLILEDQLAVVELHVLASLLHEL